MARASSAVPTPTINRETTRGMTVIRIAFTHIVPIGSTKPAPVTRLGGFATRNAAPATKPRSRARRTRVVGRMPLSYAQNATTQHIQQTLSNKVVSHAVEHHPPSETLMPRFRHSSRLLGLLLAAGAVGTTRLHAQ